MGPVGAHDGPRGDSRAPDGPTRRGPGRAVGDHAGHTLGDVDVELHRLEAVLAAYPDDRALPDLEQVLHDACVGASLLVEDDRARKLWLDALVTRPLGELSAVREVAADVELLVLEVRHVRATLGRPDIDGAERDDAVARLAWVRERLTALLEVL